MRKQNPELALSFRRITFLNSLCIIPVQKILSLKPGKGIKAFLSLVEEIYLLPKWSLSSLPYAYADPMQI